MRTGAGQARAFGRAFVAATAFHLTVLVALAAPPISVHGRPASGAPASSAETAQGPGGAAAKDSSAAGAGRATRASRLGPAVLAGPCRLTLAGGKTVDGIAVSRNRDRVRLILEDGTVLTFETSKVVSIVALADIDSEAPAASPKPQSDRGVARAGGASGPAARKSAPATRSTARSRAQSPAGREAAAPAATSPSASTSNVRNGRVSVKPVSKSAAAPLPTTSSEAAATPPNPASDSGDDFADEDATLDAADAGSGSVDTAEAPSPGRPALVVRGRRSAGATTDEDVADMAHMLEAAINQADLEGAHPPDSGAAKAGEEVSGPNQEEAGEPADTTGAPPAGPPGKEDTVRHPKPEDMDATRPVRTPGFRFLGPKGELPETPPPDPDFPAPAEPTVSLGASIWKPTESFGSSAKWGEHLQPATSFPNALSGWGPPVTSFGPRYWTPPPVQWAPSVFNDVWKPSDGFAKVQQQKAPPEPAPPPPETNK